MPLQIRGEVQEMLRRPRGEVVKKLNLFCFSSIWPWTHSEEFHSFLNLTFSLNLALVLDFRPVLALPGLA